VEWSAVVGVEDSPGFDVGVDLLDDPAEFVDAGVSSAVLLKYLVSVTTSTSGLREEPAMPFSWASAASLPGAGA
jgi:hypothetical protein